MKILFSSLVACTLCALFAFSSKVYLNSPNISMEKMVKYTVQYKNGATSTRLLSTTELKRLAFSKEDPNVGNCTVQTPSGGCASTASTCSEALGKFATCLCGSGYSNWCATGGGSDSDN